MRRLTTSQALACEKAEKPACKCRCGGLYHGRSHSVLLEQESKHETELLEVQRQDFVHLLQVWGLSDLLPVPQPATDLPRLERGRVRDSRDAAQISWLTEYGRLIKGG
jgi:hypothetical protein